MSRLTARSQSPGDWKYPRIGVQILEAGTSEESQTLEVEESHGHVRRVFIGEFENLLRGPPGYPRRTDRHEWRRFSPGAMHQLQNRLSEQRNEPIGTSFGGSLEFHGVLHLAVASTEIADSVAVSRESLDLPAGGLKDEPQLISCGKPAVCMRRFARKVGKFHCCRVFQCHFNMAKLINLATITRRLELAEQFWCQSTSACGLKGELSRSPTTLAVSPCPESLAAP